MAGRRRWNERSSALLSPCRTNDLRAGRPVDPAGTQAPGAGHRVMIRERGAVEHEQGILIIDFGSQYTQLIARRVREAHVYCEIHPPSRTIDWIREWNPKGIILSGGPNSVYGDSVPTADPGLVDLGIPVLGVCYGMQLLAQLSGGKVQRASRREYGRATLTVLGGRLFEGFGSGDETPVWMSHGDHVD